MPRPMGMVWNLMPKNGKKSRFASIEIGIARMTKELS
jgi:hypothetical protein